MKDENNYENLKPCYLQFKFEPINHVNNVYIVGNTEELGSWNINKAEKLKQFKNNNLWRTRENILSNQNTLIEYKYFFIIDNNIIWEDSVNRQVFTNKYIRIIVLDDTIKHRGYLENFTIDPNTYLSNDSESDHSVEHKKDFLEGFDTSDKKPRVLHYLNPNHILFEEFFTLKESEEKSCSIEEIKLNCLEGLDLYYAPEENNNSGMAIVEEYDLLKFKEERERVEPIEEIKEEIKIHDMKSKLEVSSIGNKDRKNTNTKTTTTMNMLNTINMNKLVSGNESLNKTNNLNYFSNSSSSINFEENDKKNDKKEDLLNNDHNNNNDHEILNCYDADIPYKPIENTNNGQLIIVSAFLPCYLTRKSSEQQVQDLIQIKASSTGGEGVNKSIVNLVNEVEYEVHINDDSFYSIIYDTLIKTKRNFKWLGILNTNLNINEENQDLINFELQKSHFYCIPSISNTLKDEFNFFIDNYLEVIFHCSDYLNNKKIIFSFDKAWQAFKTVNEEMAKFIMKHIPLENQYITFNSFTNLNNIQNKPNNSNNISIWIHDYHLLLVPLKLRVIMKNINANKIKIGLFLHEPFPASEIFMRFQFKDEIIKSMLSVDLLGFHTFSTCRNFFSFCKRNLNILVQTTNSGHLALTYKGKAVIIVVKNMYVEPSLIRDMYYNEKVKSHANQIKSMYDNSIIILSFVTQQYESTLNLQLKAYKKLLLDLKNDNKHKLFTLIIVLNDLNSTKVLNEDTIKDFTEETQKLISNIKQIVGEKSIIFLNKIKSNMSKYERMGLLLASDIFVNLQSRGKYSLLCAEFISLKKYQSSNSPFSCVISNTSGESSTLASAIKVNSHDYNSILFGFAKAIETHISKFNQNNDQELLQRLDFKHAEKYTCSRWIDEYISNLSMKYYLIETKHIENNFVDNFSYFHQHEKPHIATFTLPEGCFKITKSNITNIYFNGKYRLILIDFEGVIVNYKAANQAVSIRKNSYLFEKILKLINSLANDVYNSIYIIAGKESLYLKELLEDSANYNNIGFALEHGYLYKLPGETNWKQLIKKGQK